MPDRVGKQELEIVLGNEHISFTVIDYIKENTIVLLSCRLDLLASNSFSITIPTIYIIITIILSQTSKIGSLLDVQESQDPEGLRLFYYLVQDLKCFVFSLITLHFKVIVYLSLGLLSIRE